MKNWGKKSTAVLFLGVIFAMLCCFALEGVEIREAVRASYLVSTNEESTFWDKTDAFVDVTEYHLDERNPLRTDFININGAVQRFFGKRIIEDVNPAYTVYRLNDDRLTFNVEPIETMHKAQSLAMLSKWCTDRNIAMLYCQIPFKVDPYDPQLPIGIKDSANDNATALLNELSCLGVDTLDLRSEIKNDGLDHASMFYKTDSHWNTEAAFWANSVVCELLEAKGFAVDCNATNRSRYNKKTYEDVMFGSQGYRVGTLYAGVDDFDMLLPSFETNLSYTVPVHDIHKTGSFAYAVMDYSHIDTIDYYKKCSYYVYSGGDYPASRIENHNYPDGAKVLLVRDSFSCAFAPFMSLAVGRVDTFDLRYNDQPLDEYIEETSPDVVIVMYNPGVIQEDIMFQFGLKNENQSVKPE